MKFYFYPIDEKSFKEQAVNNFVHTIVFDTDQLKVAKYMSRHVKKIWGQTCKNNLQTDHRIKELSGDNYRIFSWVGSSKKEFILPNFYLFE